MNKIKIAVGMGLSLMGAAVNAANTYGHEPVSSDGSIVDNGSLVELASTRTQGVSGFPGTRTPGMPLDALAEFAASVATPAEMDALAEYKPAIPAYAKDRPQAESVIGDDSRYRIYPKESGYPERAIGYVTFNQGGGSASCTAWLIGPNTVATAGHCVHSGGSGGVWSSNFIFYPGRNGSKSPFGSCSARTLFSVTGWTVSHSENFDYGAAKLNCNVGNTTGWFGWFWQSASLVGLPVQVSGYPGDKPTATHWSTSGDIEVSETLKTRYKHDTFGGQSGGPVFQTDRVGSFCTGPCVTTIHAYGVSGGFNSGTRITESLSNNLISWRNAP